MSPKDEAQALKELLGATRYEMQAPLQTSCLLRVYALAIRTSQNEVFG